MAYLEVRRAAVAQRSAHLVHGHAHAAREARHEDVREGAQAEHVRRSVPAQALSNNKQGFKLKAPLSFSTIKL